MNNNFSVGHRIKEYRILRGMSQEQLALDASITPAYLGLIERNVKNPTIAIIFQICAALDVSLSDFFSENDRPIQALDPLSQQILYQVKDKTDVEKTVILQIIKQALKLQQYEKHRK